MCIGEYLNADLISIRCVIQKYSRFFFEIIFFTFLFKNYILRMATYSMYSHVRTETFIIEANLDIVFFIKYSLY